MLAETTRPVAVRETAPRLGFLRSWDTAIIVAVLLSIAVEDGDDDRGVPASPWPRQR